jgi:hypothetical protein
MSSSKRLSRKDWVKYILGRGMYQPSRAICNMLVPMFQQPGRNTSKLTGESDCERTKKFGSREETLLKVMVKVL